MPLNTPQSSKTKTAAVAAGTQPKSGTGIITTVGAQQQQIGQPGAVASTTTSTTRGGVVTGQKTLKGGPGSGPGSLTGPGGSGSTSPPPTTGPPPPGGSGGAGSGSGGSGSGSGSVRPVGTNPFTGALPAIESEISSLGSGLLNWRAGFAALRTRFTGLLEPSYSPPTVGVGEITINLSGYPTSNPPPIMLTVSPVGGLNVYQSEPEAPAPSLQFMIAPGQGVDNAGAVLSTSLTYQITLSVEVAPGSWYPFASEQVPGSALLPSSATIWSLGWPALIQGGTVEGVAQYQGAPAANVQLVLSGYVQNPNGTSQITFEVTGTTASNGIALFDLSGYLFPPATTYNVSLGPPAGSSWSGGATAEGPINELAGLTIPITLGKQGAVKKTGGPGPTVV